MSASAWWRDWDLAAESLAAESEAFLAGGLAEHLLSVSCRVPVWAWTNLLAHGTDDDLRHPPQAAGSFSYWGLPTWRHARSYLAAEVLEAAGPGGLSELQRTVLVPLELQLISRRETAMWQPGDWVKAVSDGLAAPAAQPRHQRRG